MLKQIGSRVRALREHKQWSQQDLAEKSDLQRSHISLIENNERTPGADSLIKLANSLETTTDYLLNQTDDPRPPVNPRNLSFLENAAKDERIITLVHIFLEELNDETRDLVFRIITELATVIKSRRGPDL